MNYEKINNYNNFINITDGNRDVDNYVFCGTNASLCNDCDDRYVNNSFDFEDLLQDTMDYNYN